jgi:hypothetical protein
MQAPALIRLTHDGLRGLAYGMERIGKMDKNDRKYEQFASVSHLINGYWRMGSKFI